MSVPMMLSLFDGIALVAYGFAKRKLKLQALRLTAFSMFILLWTAIMFYYVFSRQPLMTPRWNLIPLRTAAPTEIFYREFAINGLLYVFMGLLLSGMLPHCGAKVLILIGVGLSACFEVAQWTVHIGVCDINDLIASAVGCTLGVFLAQRVGGFPKNRKTENKPSAGGTVENRISA